MKKNIWLSAITANIIALLIMAGLLIAEVLSPLHFSLYDSSMERSMSGKAHEDIIVVGLDEKSFEEIGRFPWDRKVYIDFLEKLNQPENKPKAIAFDVSFASATDQQSDHLLTEALEKYDNVIFPWTANLQSEFSRSVKVTGDGPIMAYGVEKPYTPFAEVTHNAHINALIDSDTKIRRTWLQIATPEDGVLDALALRAVKLAGYEVDKRLMDNPQSEILIDFEAKSFDIETVSFSTVLQNEDFPLSIFKDRIVFIGFNAPGTERDNRSTPVEKDMMLVFAHANIANQLIQGSEIKTTAPDLGANNKLISTLTTLLMFLLVLWLTWRTKTIASIVVLSFAIIAMFAGQYYLFAAQNWYIDILYPLAGMLLAYLVNIAVKSFFENKQRNYITKQFGRYISPDLVKEIAASGQELKLGGINKELSILFLDIRGFTTLSEKLKPEEVVDFLNTMFNLITEKALENQGSIDKFIGDAAMIVFNAPLDVTHHEYYAVKTAYDIQKGMEDVRNQVLEKYHVTISIGVGVHTGEVVIGNIGSYLRVDYTAIGDNVNIAARIESNTVANQILVSEDTYERTKEHFEYNYVGEKMMKGKTVPIKLYEVKEWKRGV